MNLGWQALKIILGATRNCGRWPDMETVKLPEFILGTAIVGKISINVLELLVTLPGCSRWRRN